MPPPDARIWVGRGHAGLDHQVQPVAEAEGDALEHRPGHVPPIVPEGQADERAPRQRVGMRAPLAGQVGQEEQARRQPAGTSAAEATRSANDGVGGERVAEPAQAAGRGQHHRHQVPATRDRVAERVDAPARLEQRPVGRGEDDARRPERQRRRPRRHDPDTDRVGRLVAAARHDRRPGAQPGRGGGPVGDRAGDLRPFECRRQPVARDRRAPTGPRRTSHAPPGRTGACPSRRPCPWRGRRSAAGAGSPWAAGRAPRGARRPARGRGPRRASAP